MHNSLFVLALGDQSYQLAQSNIEQFKHAWAAFDPKASHFIASSQLLPLLKTVEQPMGLLNAQGGGGDGHAQPDLDDPHAAKRLMRRLNIPEVDGMLQFHEVLEVAQCLCVCMCVWSVCGRVYVCVLSSHTLVLYLRLP